MCEPFSIAVASAIGSIAATGASMYTQNKAMQSQNRANEAWRQKQAQMREAEQIRQDTLRGKAEEARQAGLEQMAPDKQQEAQTAEATRLDESLTRNTQLDANPADNLLAGTTTGGEAVKADAASKLNKASADARDRIKALATVQSYGGSFGGLQNRNAEILGQADQGINMANNMRQGSLGAYNIAKGVNPIKYGPVQDPFAGIASALAGMSGSAFGNAAAGAAKGAGSVAVNPSLYPTTSAAAVKF